MHVAGGHTKCMTTCTYIRSYTCNILFLYEQLGKGLELGQKKGLLLLWLDYSVGKKYPFGISHDNCTSCVYNMESHCRGKRGCCVNNMMLW